jgi:hypothetical protein
MGHIPFDERPASECAMRRPSKHKEATHHVLGEGLSGTQEGDVAASICRFEITFLSAGGNKTTSLARFRPTYHHPNMVLPKQKQKNYEVKKQMTTHVTIQQKDDAFEGIRTPAGKAHEKTLC